MVGPGAVLAMAGMYLTEPTAWAPNERVQKIDRELAAQPFSTVVSGPSFARTDIDNRVLGEGLGFDPARVVNLPVNSSPPPVWYAILKYRVFDAGHEPRLVVLVVTMASLMGVKPNPSHMTDLTEHYAEPDETLRTLTFAAARPAWLERALERRGSLRASVLEPFRRGVVGALVADEGADVGQLVAHAGDKVFGAQHAAARFQLPGARVETEADAPSPYGTSEVDPRNGYLPALARVVQEGGARLAIVLPPTAPRASGGQYLDHAAEQQVIALCNELGIGWIDLRALVYAEEDYVDGRHMRPPAAKRFTAEVVKRLIAIGATDAGGKLRAMAVLQPEAIERVGGDATPQLGLQRAGQGPCQEVIELVDGGPLAEDQLMRLPGRMHSPIEVLQDGELLPQVATAAELGAGCTGRVWHHDGRIDVRRAPGDGPPVTLRLAAGLPVRNGGNDEAWWTWPDSTLRWRYAAPPDADAADLVVQVELQATSLSGDLPTLRVGDVDEPFVAEGRVLRATARVPRPAGAWSIEIDSPSSAPYAEVRALRWSAGEIQQDVVAPASTRWVDILPDARIIAPAPPAPTVVKPEVTPKGSWLPAPWVNKSTCTPLRLLADGVPVPHATPDVAAGRPPASGFAHLVDKVWFPTATEGAPPQYTLGLEPDRLCWARGCKICGERVWLYPGDKVAVRVAADRRRSTDLRLRAVRIHGESADGSPAPAPLGVALSVGGVARLDERVTLDQLNEGRLLAVEPAVIRDFDRAVELTLESPATNPPLLLRVWGGAEDPPLKTGSR